MLAFAGYVQADALQPDPAWQQGTLATGYSGSAGLSAPAIVFRSLRLR